MSKLTRIQKVLEELTQAGEVDLLELREEIARQEAAIEALVAERRQALDALRQLEKALDLRLYGKPARKAKHAESGSVRPRKHGSPSARERIFDYLSAADEALKPATIAAELSLSKGTVYAALKHEWFEETPDGWVIAKT